jgi:hypothetical membrane protein
MRTVLLAAGIAIPFLYFANLFGIAAMTPGFDHGSQLPSDLGSEETARAVRQTLQCTHCAGSVVAFNIGLIAVGVCALLASAGLWLGLRASGANPILALLTALSVACLGIAMVMAGAFPLPNPLHYGFNIIAGMLLTGLFGAFVLKGAARWIALAGFMAGLGVLALNAGVGGVATENNIGWIIRLHALIAFSTIAFVCWAVMQRARSA